MVSEVSSEEASLSDVFLYVNSGDRFVQLMSALFCQILEFMIGGFTRQSKKTSFWVVVVSLLSLLPIS